MVGKDRLRSWVDRRACSAEERYSWGGGICNIWLLYVRCAEGLLDQVRTSCHCTLLALCRCRFRFGCPPPRRGGLLRVEVVGSSLDSATEPSGRLRLQQRGTSTVEQMCSSPAKCQDTPHRARHLGLPSPLSVPFAWRAARRGQSKGGLVSLVPGRPLAQDAPRRSLLRRPPEGDAGLRLRQSDVGGGGGSSKLQARLCDTNGESTKKAPFAVLTRLTRARTAFGRARSRHSKTQPQGVPCGRPRSSGRATARAWLGSLAPRMRGVGR